MSAVEFTPPFKMIVDGVKAYFAENGVTAAVDRGWKKRSEQINQGTGRANRVIFIGSKLDGSIGRFVKPREVGISEIGGDPTTDPPTPATHKWRPLCDWQRTVLVSIWAFDGDNKNDEGAQDDALYQLITWTFRAVNSVAFGNADFGNAQVTVPKERGFGLEMLIELTFQTPIADLPLELSHPDAVVDRPQP